MKIKTLLHLLPNSYQLQQAILAMRSQKVLSTENHLRLCSEWLLKCQSIYPDGGYSASFSLITGWSSSYIETTGYIIPTMFNLAEFFQEPKYKESALHAGEWLSDLQHPLGYFTDIDELKPQVFDTGQDLMGLNFLYKQTSDQRYLESARKAGDWLIKVQDSDGSWTTMGYNRGRPSTYHTRVASALLELGQLTGDDRYITSGNNNLLWAMNCQQENGYFLHAELHEGNIPVLHTIVYVLEGFLFAYLLTKNSQWLETLLKGVRPLMRINASRDIVLLSQYDENFSSPNKEKCLPGLAQWAGLCLDLYEITGEHEYFEVAMLSIYYLKSKQVQNKGFMNGALPASIPIWGHYHPLIFTNWGVKFFADVLLKYSKYNVEEWQEQEAWVKKCLELKLDGGAWDSFSTQLVKADYAIFSEIDSVLDLLKSENIKILDLGCGRGRYLKYIKDNFPQWELYGIDPFYSDGNLNIKHGSAYNIPFPDSSLDVVYTYIVMQHISDMQRVLAEIKRVLKPGGYFIICDRNLISGRGCLKSYNELRGKWIYSWDSPFRERWYTRYQWKKILEKADFTVNRIHNMNDPDDKGLRRVIRMNSLLFIESQVLKERN